MVPTNPTPAYCNNISHHLIPIDLKKYSYEALWGVLFLIAIAVFINGRSRNDTIAKTWKKACGEVISQNFAHFGLTKEPSADMEKLSYSEYQYYASGRVNVPYTLFRINLKKR